MAFPASSQLPDEITKEILAPVLYVPDETFADTALKASPFATYGLSSSTILVVCKSWLRVATPLLYDTVVLRSKAQAQSLAVVLKKDSQLGTFIKKLRVEGGYGNAIFEILKRSPYITDIWISTALWSNESVVGYAKGLLLVDPRRLIVVDDRLKTSAIRERVYEALEEAIKKRWKNLNTVVLEIPRPELQRTSDLVDALAQSPAQIEHLGLLSTHANWVKLMTLPSVKSIRVCTVAKKFDWGSRPEQYASSSPVFDSALQQDRALYDKTTYHQSEQKPRAPTSRVAPKGISQADAYITAAPLDPNWKPLEYASQESRDTIWTKILGLAMSPLSPGTGPSHPTLSRFTWHGNRAGLVRVCREFHRLGTPFLYEVVILGNTRMIVKLNASPHKGHIKEIWLQQYHSFIYRRGIVKNELDTGALADLIGSCNNLVIVSQARACRLEDRDAGPVPMPYLWNEEKPDIELPVQTLVSLSERSAGTLQHFNLGVQLDEDEDKTQQLALIVQALGHFRELRSLTLCTGGNYAVPGRKINVKLPRDAFAKVERLRMFNNSVLNSSIMGTLATDVELPSITHATIRAMEFGGFSLIHTVYPFFSVHGHKIAFLGSPSSAGHMFDVLQNLLEWEITPDMVAGHHNNFDFLDDLEEDEHISTLKSITFTSYGLSNLAEALNDLDLTPFKALETVQIAGGLEWPTNQRDIDKSVWVKIAERLRAKQNIKVLDHTGKAWVPRLKPTAVSRSRRK
ncbi:hypothetical protein BKA70DRAFT_1278146 [Coprinopsis sp. MPI-PUGE-AT-0042]|nr:hypothetical protein BKA70DRAFT_1278146 [Coprinopsis sp. MPI-PUGE-AT-0042]